MILRGTNKRRRAQGLTLIELLVVVTLIGLASAAVVLGMGAVTDAEVKNAALKVVAASRFASARAVTQGNTTRLHFDFEAGTMAVEEAEGSMVLARADDPEREEGAEGIVDPWAAAEARLTETFEPSLGESPFGPILGRNQTALEAYVASPLGRNVEVVQLLGIHEPEARTSGEASIYFFPSGLATESVLWLSDGRDKTISVVIHPLTGRARIEKGAFELEIRSEDAFDEDASEVRDPS